MHAPTAIFIRVKFSASWSICGIRLAVWVTSFCSSLSYFSTVFVSCLVYLDRPKTQCCVTDQLDPHTTTIVRVHVRSKSLIHLTFQLRWRPNSSAVSSPVDDLQRGPKHMGICFRRKYYSAYKVSLRIVPPHRCSRQSSIRANCARHLPLLRSRSLLAWLCMHGENSRGEECGSL